MKRECDRCHHLTLVGSLNEREMRLVHVERGATASTNGGATILTTDYDLCATCLAALADWVENSDPVDAVKLSDR